MKGVLVVDKPAGMTSHDVVAQLRRITGERAVGHLGTLDPMATGVLPLLLGRMTRLAQFYTGSDKRYEGEIRLGFATSTYDAEGEPSGPPTNVKVTLEQVCAAAQPFTGAIRQTPPPFSAKKVAGVPAYKLARKKREVELQPINVTVFELTIVDVEGERVRFRAHVSAGTYLRSIAHDLGAVLGVGGHLAALRRTAVGEFSLDDAHSLEPVRTAAERDGVSDLMVNLRRILPSLPAVTASEETAAMIRNGRPVNLPDTSGAPLVKVFCPPAELIAIAQRVAGTLFRSKVVFLGN